MYCVVWEGSGENYCCLASYGETLYEACDGLMDYCSESISAGDDEELYENPDYVALEDGTYDEEFIKNFQMSIGDGDVTVLLLVDSEEDDAKEKVIEFIEESPIDLSDYYDEEDELDTLNLHDYLDNLPAVFEHLQEILYDRSYGA